MAMRLPLPGHLSSDRHPMWRRASVPGDRPPGDDAAAEGSV